MMGWCSYRNIESPFIVMGIFLMFLYDTTSPEPVKNERRSNYEKDKV
jgi:hypothetical protein